MFNSVIGALRVNLGLDSTQFQDGLKKSQRGLADFGKKMAAVGAGVAAAGAAAFAAFNNSASRLGELQKQADIAGLSAQEFKIAALAVDQYGVSQEKLSDILKDVNDKFGDFAATGGGPLADFFENIAPKVGLTIDSFKELSSSDALALYIKALEDANVSQQEMTFYMEALASDATALVPAFRDGGKAIEEMAKKAREMGLAMDDGLIKTAREAKGEISLISEVLRTQFDQAVLKLGPSLSQLAKALLPVVDGVVALIDTVLVKTDEWGKASREFVDDFIAGLNELPDAAIASISRLADGLVAGMSNIAQQAADWAKKIVASIAENLRGLYEAGVQAVKDLAAGMAAEFAALKDRAFSWGGDVVDGLKGGLVAAKDRVTSAVTGLVDSVTTPMKVGLDMHSPSKVFHQFGAWIVEGLANGIGASADLASGSMQSLSDSVSSAGENLRDSMKGVFKDVISGTKSVPQAIGDMLSSIADQLINSGLDKLFENLFAPLLNIGGDALTGALRGAGLAAIPGFANGGYHGGGLRIVGERGPELEATGAARYWSAAKTEGLLSGGGSTRVEVVPSDYFDVRVTELADQSTGRMAARIDKALPARVQQINAHPRKR